MAVTRMHHVGVVVDDLPAAVEFFNQLGLEPQDTATVEGDWVDRIVGLEDVRAEIAFVATPDGHGQLELVKFHSPAGEPGEPSAPANALGMRHVAIVVDDLDATLARVDALGAALVGSVEEYGGRYRLCYVRGPAGVIVELTEEIG